MTEYVINSAIRLLGILLDEHVLRGKGQLWEPRILVEAKAATLKGSEEHLQGLKTDLTLMLDFLEKFAGSRNNRHQLISQVRDMANDAGVIIDNFIFITSKESESIRLNNFITEIESIRSRFREVNLQSPVEEAEEDVALLQQKKAEEEEDEEEEEEEAVVVGLEKYVEILMQGIVLLDREDYTMSFLIYGMGGIGKTTLARHIYNHKVLVERFERRAWVFVSNEFNMEEVVRSLIRQVVDLTEEEEEVMKEMDVERLKNMLHQHLQGKRYFIVLDDLWDNECFHHVYNALPRKGGNSGRLLITGRFSNTLRMVVNSTLRMEHLSFDVSWQLFLKIVFNGHSRCPKHLEEIGKQIVRKCNGLPLAIKEAGRKLAARIHSKSEWEEFLESYDFSETIGVLELSYHKLSQILKSYFLHTSLFKQGTTTRIKKLAHIWDAAGIHLRQYNEREVCAKYDINQLSSTCMIMAVGDGKFKSLCIDNFLHKICIAKAQEEIGLEILRNGNHCPTPLKPRHRAIDCGREKFFSVNQNEYLLSLFFHGGSSFDASPSYWESFEQLRILDFEGFGLESLPEKLCALSRLRYLGLRDNYIQELPHTFRHLKNLEVLDIAHNFMIEVPDIIWEMDILRHLYMSNIICRAPLKIDSMKHLQTLTYISLNNWTCELSNLEKMTNLGKLGIEEVDENSDVSKLFATLAKLKKLECLILRGYHFRSMPPLDDLRSLRHLKTLKLDGRLTRLPKFPRNIHHLALVNSCLNKDPMPKLLKLSKLFSLVLKNAYTGQEMVISSTASCYHPSICIDQLCHLRNLKLVGFGFNLPKLLDICSCPYLDNIPKEIIDIHGPGKLQQLRMQTTRKIAKLIRQSLGTSTIDLDIQPY